MEVKLLKSVLAMSILLEALAASICFTSPVKAVAEIEILSDAGYLDSSGYYHVVGEVQNVGDQAVNFIRIEVTFYDSSNVDIATRLDLAMLNVLLVDRKTPFDIVLLDTTQSAKVDHYTLNLTFMATSPIPLGLEILWHSSYVDDGEISIIGEIMNIEAERARSVKIIATYYDDAGDVVAAMLTYFDAIHVDLEQGETKPFQILLTDEDRTRHVEAYELTAESAEYACSFGEPVFLPTDLNKDGIVNILDITIVASAFGSRPGNPSWNPDADLDKNGEINILDVSTVAINFGKSI